MVLCLSHGQAQVEGGFSINKDLAGLNFSEDSIVSRRVVEDHLRSVGGLENVVIDGKLLVAAGSARHK